MYCYNKQIFKVNKVACYVGLKLKFLKTKGTSFFLFEQQQKDYVNAWAYLTSVALPS